MTATYASSNPVLKAVAFTDLVGWEHDDHAAALQTFLRSCTRILASKGEDKRKTQFSGSAADWRSACVAAQAATNAKLYFETYFTPIKVLDSEIPKGLFTGYFEPEVEGSLTESKIFHVPIYAKPKDLISFNAAQIKKSGLHYGRIVSGNPVAYFTRQEIEQGALQGQGLEIAWLKSWEDAFFMQVQGSGRVTLEDGTAVRLSFAGKSGHPYTGIGGVLIDRGILTKQSNSMQSLRIWMKAHPQEARELMWANKSFVFFQKITIEDDSIGALGAQYVGLTPKRSLAVDRELWKFGTPMWLQTKIPNEAKARDKSFNHLMVAQDTGSAIKGYVRGDVYWGWGEEAVVNAGHMKSEGQLFALLPKPLVAKLKLSGKEQR